MITRSALLIGVPRCDNDLFAPMGEVVMSDIRRMAEALGQSGYQLRYCGAGDPSGIEPTGNRIRGAILAALREAPAGGVLLVYFSGHGVVLNGRSWLVPQDVYAAGSGPAQESLIPLVPADLADCRARLVLFVVDACRNDLADSLAALTGGEVLPYPSDGAFVLINSCRVGERSLHGEEGSYFTQAFAEVLDRRHPARTLDEVHDAVTRHLARKAGRTDGLEQHPELVHAQRGHRSDVGAVVVCDGDQVVEAWRRAAESAAIWDRVDGAPTDLERLRRAVLGIVDACSGEWLSARAVLESRAGLADTWSAQDYPARVLVALAHCLPAGVLIGQAELALLVAVPFLREVALSAGLRLAAGVRPQDFSRTYSDGPRSDLEITHAMHEHVCRRAEGLSRRGRDEPRDALAMWLVHRWLAERSSLWSDPAVTGLTERFAAVLIPFGTELTRREIVAFLGVLLRCVDADAGDARLIELLGTRIFDARVRTLGAALWLAGIMAADPRRMPSVVVDHIGISAELSVTTLHAATLQASWRRVESGLSLRAVCEHPALHAAFDGLVRRAADARHALSAVDLNPELAKGLPEAFHADGVRPEIADGTPAFETPLLRFRLSDEKVRELLMGRQLYGEPDLAIRELYQNALDACRYRHTRREYRRRTEQAVISWDGAIELRQGVDADGREYVECIDNGVGMSRDTLMSTFANAGERFVYRPTFRAEQTRWQELDPPLRLIPNSQFGVGVFSYFMIAEEIVIATRPVGEDDVVAGAAHSVRIASSGSLFQIVPSADMPGGGTRVRLYLTGEDRISVLRTMRRLLWVAEFMVSVQEQDGTGEVWEPEKLRYAGASVEPLQFGDDLWWVPGQGGLVADGVRTNEERHGLVVNLRGPRRPQFTVDRNRLRSWDKEWISQQVRDSLSRLQEWPGLTLSWLWRVADNSPTVAEAVFDWLVDNDREMPIDDIYLHGSSPPAARVGCLPADHELFNGDMYWSTYDGTNLWLTSWRVGVWKGILPFVGVENVPEPSRLDGFPVVRPLDASILDRLYELGHGRTPSQFGHPSVDDLLKASIDDEEPPVLRLWRLRRYAITGLDLSAMREVPPVRHVFREEDGPLTVGVENPPLLGAVAAWAPPGSPPRRAVGGWLGDASARLRISLGEVLRRAAELVPTDWVGPRVEDLGDLRDHVFTWNDVAVFSRQLNGAAPWIPPVVPPSHIVRLSSKLGGAVGAVLAIFDRFAPLGYEVASRERYPTDFTDIERETLRYVSYLDYSLTPLHLMIVAGRLGKSVREVRAGLERLVASGFVRQPPEGGFLDITPNSDERSALNETLLSYNIRLGIPVPALGWAAVILLIREVGSRELAGFEERLARHRRLLDLVELRRPVTMPEIIDIAYWLDYTVAQAIDYYKALYPFTADLSALPECAASSSAACHRYEEREALITPTNAMNHGRHDVAWELTAGDIVRGAAMSRQSVTAYLDTLEPFRTLGAPLPQLSEADRELLAERIADRFDVAMLRQFDEYGIPTTLREVGPFWLVHVAGRFGWTLAEAYRRMARLRPLGLVFGCRAEDCPEEIVHWQDLLAVTVHLDGQEPVVTGAVGAEHLTAAAGELAESVDVVRARLDRYAGLLGFTVVERAVVV
ncbi:caspase family protein [Micromonospora coxensis]|uniref:wHTH domain-containing protein n=1 Tax=Micromonospora coxensis TaxID=356852 RepID=UPI003427134A